MKILQILVLMFGLVVFSNAQNSEKVFLLSGTVYDVNKAVIVVAKITVESENGKKFNTVSNDEGVYKLSLPFGKYTIEFQKDGFKLSRFINYENFTLTEKHFDVTLGVGRCEDCNGAIYGERWDDSAFLDGFVYDSNGAVIGNAKISFRDAENNLKTVTTNKNGNYKIKLPIGILSIEIEAVGFKVFKIKNYRIAPTNKKGMNLDVVLEGDNSEPCGYSGADCLNITPIDTKTIETKVSDKISQRPLEKLPKEQNKTKRKTKNNK